MATGSQAKSPMSTAEGGQASGCPAGHERQKPRPQLPGPSPACAALAAMGGAPWGVRGSVSAALLVGLLSACVLHSAVQTLNAQRRLHLRFYFSSEKWPPLIAEYLENAEMYRKGNKLHLQLCRSEVTTSDIFLLHPLPIVTLKGPVEAPDKWNF